MNEATKELEVIQDEAKNVGQKVHGMVVENEEHLSEVTDIVKDIKKFKKHVEAEKEKFTAPAKEIIAQAKSKYDPFIEYCAKLEKELKEKATEYIIKRNRETAEKKEEIVEKAESGKIKTETAVKRLEKLPEETNTARGEKGTLSVKMIKDIEIVDEKLIPREYLIPDLKKIKAVVIAGVEVAGVKLIEKPSASIR